MKNLIFIISLMVLSVELKAQFSGPDYACPGQEATFTYDCGSCSHSWTTWVVNEGQILSQDLTSSSQASVTVLWDNELDNPEMNIYDGSGQVYSTEVDAGTWLDCNNGMTSPVTGNFIFAGTAENLVKSTVYGNVSSGDPRENYQYFDGLGRPALTVQGEAAHNGGDVIQPVGYDVYGREARSFLPYTYDQGVDAGDYRVDNYSEQNSFYTSDGDYAASDREYEPSPLHRVLREYGPGDEWASHPVEYVYGINDTDEVQFFEVVDGELVNDGFYDAGELSKTTVYDENGVGTEEFVDKNGQTILKRSHMFNAQTTPGGDEYADTYYVYDDFGNLVFVLPPELIEKTFFSESTTNLLITDTEFDTSTNGDWYYNSAVTITLSDGFESTDFSLTAVGVAVSDLDGYAFQYKYDKRHRMVEKKVPGAGWVYMVYDDRDRLVLTQDANQREDDEWIYTKYDALNRPVITGIYSNGASRTAMQTTVDAITDFDEIYTGTGALGGYDGSGFPGTSLADILTITYYDNYDFKSDLSWGSTYNSGFSHHTAVKGQVTGGQVRVLGGNLLKSITYFDSRYRPRVSITENHLSGVDKVTTTYENIVSPNVLSVTRAHSTSLALKTISETYTYDEADRLVTTVTTIDGNTSTVTNSYNTRNELSVKDLNDVQAVDYRYNIRGWLTTINGGTSFQDEGDVFGMRLYYTDALSGYEQYNGNIGRMKWKVVGASVPNTSEQEYNFSYDALNRLTTADYFSSSKDDYQTVSGITYDRNGNILSLDRKMDGGVIDQLTYDYALAGNQLQSVSDASSTNAALGFDDGNSGTDYTYDPNGNMTQDLNKDITGITYNHLNLPEQVSYTDGNGTPQTVTYTYDAAGVKLQKISSAGSTTDYIAGIQYLDNAVDFVQIPEGRYRFGTTDFTYDLKDHLGNVRATVAEVESSVSEQLFEFNNMGELYVEEASISTSDYVSSPSSLLFPEDNAGDAIINVGVGTVVVSVWMKHPSGSNNEASMEISYKADGSSTETSLTELFNTGQTWNEYSSSALNIPSSGQLICRFKNDNLDHWFYADDLKISYTGASTVTTVEVIQSQDYYPFGLTFNSYTSGTENLYKYNGKEEQKEWGVLDFDTRMHDPALGRFMGIDLMSEDYSFQSPYVYAANNPIMFIDYMGMCPCKGEEGCDCDEQEDQALVQAPPPVSPTVLPLRGLGLLGALYYFASGQAAADAMGNNLDGTPKDQKEYEPKPYGEPREDSETETESENVVHRGGSFTDKNFTPRPGKDDVEGHPKRGLSTFRTHEQATMGQGGKSQVLNVDKLRSFGFEVAEDPDGHVSIRPPSNKMLKDWAASRPGLDSNKPAHVLTRMIQMSWVRQKATPKTKR